MRPYRQLAGLLFAALGIYLMVQGVKLKIDGDFGPGPGFMPFVVGALLAASSAIWIIQVALAGRIAFPADMLPDRQGIVRLVIVSAAMLVFAAVFDIIGFKLSMLAFLILVPFVFGRDHPAWKIGISLAFSFGLFFLFERVLRVPLPIASIDALAAFGL